MRQIYRTFAVAMLTAGMISVGAGADAAISDAVSVFGGTNTDETSHYRIPALANDGNGTLVAFVDDRGENGSDIGVNDGIAHVLYKISKDNGTTWSEARRLAPESFTHQHGDVAVAYDAGNRRFVVLFVGDESWGTNKRGTIWVTYSTNPEYTAWSEPKDVTSQFVPDTNYRGFASSGTMLYRDGAVYVVLCKSTNKMSSLIGKSYISNVLYKTTDGGENWTKVSEEYEKGDESHVVSLSDGNLVLSRRKNGNGSGYKYRNFWRSTDGGKTFGVLSTTIDESGCNGDLLVYDDGRTEWLLQSLNLNRSGDYINNRPLVIYASSDAGGSWVQTNTIDDGEYSCLTRLQDGSVGVLYEKNDGNRFGAYFRTMSVEDITPSSTTAVFDGYLNTAEQSYLSIDNAAAKQLAEVAGNGVLTVTAKVLCSKFESGSEAKERGVMGTRTGWTSRLLNYIGGFEMYGGNATNPFGINVSVSQGSGKDHVLANQIYRTFYEKDKDKWTHITLVFDPANSKCWSYVNGQKYEEQGYASRNGNSKGNGDQYSSSLSINNAKGEGLDVHSILAIGTRLSDSKGDAGLIWQGGIDDVRFYNKALSQEEIEADIKSGFPLFTGARMRGAFDFSAKDGEQMSDITGKNIVATAVNTTVYRFPETDQEATRVDVHVLDREGNEIEGMAGAYTLYRYKDGALAVQPDGARASVNTDFLITARQTVDDYTLYAIYVNDREVDPFDFGVTDFGIGTDVAGGYFKSGKTVNDVKVVYNYAEETPDFKLVGENHYTLGNNHVTNPYEYMFTNNGNGTYTLSVPTSDPCFNIVYFSGNTRLEKNTMTGVFHVDEVIREEMAAEYAAADGAEAQAAVGGRSFYAHQVHRQQMSHQAVRMTNGQKLSLQNSDNQTTPIHFTTNDPANPYETAVGFNNPEFTLIFTPTERTLQVNVAGGTTGVESVSADNSDAPVEIYTLQGVRVSETNLTPGFYIRRQGRHASKILVR